jgi:hypothetical protein
MKSNLKKNLMLFGSAKSQANSASTHLIFDALACLPGLIHDRESINVIDDLYIKYRFAQNLIDGNGLVFNEGERFYGSTAMEGCKIRQGYLFLSTSDQH